MLKIQLTLLLTAFSITVAAETPAQWAAKWQGVGTNYTGQPSFYGTAPSASQKNALISKIQGMTNDEVWLGLSTRSNGISAIAGTCQALMVSGTPTFIIAGQYGTHGHSGYPKNPVSQDGTGHLDSCYNEHSVTGLCGITDWKARSKATVLMALQNDACTNVQGMASKQPVQISILDSSKLYFVKPTESCSGGKPLCGTTSIGDSEGQYASFNQLPEKFCTASYGVIEKAMASFRVKGKALSSGQSRFITCEQWNQKKIQSSILSEAKTVMTHLNDRFYDIALPYSGYSETQLFSMNNAELALFFVSVKESENLVPAIIRGRIATLTPAELEGARTQYQVLLDAVKANATQQQQNYTLAQAIAYIQNK